MEKICEITEEQWLSLTQRVMTGLHGRKGGGGPLELSYEQVAPCLGYTAKVDFTGRC